MGLKEDLEILAHELECDPGYNFKGLMTSDGDKFTDKLSRLRAALSGAAVDVVAERQRQISKEGWTPEHDDQHDKGQLAEAASCYADASVYAGLYGEAPPNPSDDWPWDWDYWKPTDRRRMLVKAGALILAEIERLDRAAQRNETVTP